MSWNNKVIWSEGMFLRPQHFQQHARYVESYTEGRCGNLRNHSWGFRELKLDPQLLAMGKLSIVRASGVFPDGTPFSIPDTDDPPLPLELSEKITDADVYLALPARREGMTECDTSNAPDTLARYAPRECQIRDSNADADAESTVPLQLGTLRLSLLLDTADESPYVKLGVARLIEVRSDGTLLIDDQFIPPILDCQVSNTLSGFMKEIHGLLHHRAEALAGRISQSGRGGAAEIADFLMLQVSNRYQPVVEHLSSITGIHPEEFYRLAIEMAGELATFTAKSKRPIQFPVYRHDDLRASFVPVMRELRQALSMVLEQTAVPIELQMRKYGIRVGLVADRSLFDQASFVLAVSAAMSTEQLRKVFPAQVKIGSPDMIRDLVNSQLPGIAVRPLPVAPRQIPYHAGFVYFELERGNSLWSRLKAAGSFAIHVSGTFPDIELEFWAIKG